MGDDPRLPPMEHLTPRDIPFQGIVEQALAGVYVVCDERFRYVNQTFASMFGYAPGQMNGMHLRELVTPESGDDVMEKYRQRIVGEVPSIRYTTRCRHQDGHTVYLEIHGARVVVNQRYALSGIAIDVSERVERRRDLARSREQLRELARHINAAREEQRANFARDVHDVLGGMLSSIKMDVTRILRRAAAPELDEIRLIGADLLVLAQETIDAARRIADESRPTTLDSLGLGAALQEMTEKFGLRSGIDAGCSLGGSDARAAVARISSDRAIHCYRIVQEALTNVGRHSGARRVNLTVAAREGGVQIRIQDDGRGIAPGTGAAAGIGMVSMAERAREISGRLDVAAASSGGTAITLWVPFEPRGAPP